MSVENVQKSVNSREEFTDFVILWRDFLLYSMNIYLLSEKIIFMKIV